MRNAECGIERRGRSHTDPPLTFRIPHCRDTIPAMSYQTLLFDLRDAIAFITINRPDKLNALNDQVVDELADAAERVATEDAIKGAILSGAGQKAFVAGRSEEHTSELQSLAYLVCRLLLEKKKNNQNRLLATQSMNAQHRYR